MIEIKKFIPTENNIMQFLSLMEKCLTPQTKEWFEWKYLKNPLNINGEPFIFGAYDGQRLVGIRPFMLSEVAYNDEKYLVAQPCDSAVDPEYQRQGIFSKMNRKAIEEAESQNINFFFNFPNANSENPYLKLGWQTLNTQNEQFLFNDFSKLVKARKNNPFYMAAAKGLSLIFNKKKNIVKNYSASTSAIPKINNAYLDNSFEELWHLRNNNQIRISRDSKYLKWRFARPDKNYDILEIKENNSLLAYSIVTFSDRWKVEELQIVDFNYREIAYIIDLIIFIISNYTFDFLSISAYTDSMLFERLKKMGFYSRNEGLKKIMPERKVLIKDLKTNKLKEVFNKINNWELRLSDHDVY
jgi:GNAT superfamily N-acetyltransferase